MKCRVVVFFVGFFFSFLFLPQRTEQHDVGGGGGTPEKIRKERTREV